jgi:hypothetical protein
MELSRANSFSFGGASKRWSQTSVRVPLCRASLWRATTERAAERSDHLIVARANKPGRKP